MPAPPGDRRHAGRCHRGGNAVRPDAATGKPPGAPGPVSAAARAESVVAAARDDPAGRLRLAADFYRLRVAGRSIRSYRRAEVAFMRWQIKRGVLAAPDGERPGSPWWRAVNESLLRDTTEAALLYGGAPGSPSAAAVRHWISFLRRPSLRVGTAPTTAASCPATWPTATWSPARGCSSGSSWMSRSCGCSTRTRCSPGPGSPSAASPCSVRSWAIRGTGRPTCSCRCRTCCPTPTRSARSRSRSCASRRTNWPGSSTTG